MTIYISATTRPAWSQQRQGLIITTNTETIESHLRKIAERELARTRAEVFEVTAIDEKLNRIRILVERQALFTVEYRAGQASSS